MLPAKLEATKAFRPQMLPELSLGISGFRPQAPATTTRGLVFRVDLTAPLASALNADPLSAPKSAPVST